MTTLLHAHRREMEARLRCQWDEIAGKYDWSAYEYSVVMPALKRELGELVGRRVVELGCGTGVVTRALLELGACVTAVDRSPAMLARAQDALANLDRLELIQADFTGGLPRNWGGHEVALFPFSLEHQHPEDALASSLQQARELVRCAASPKVYVLMPHPCHQWSQEGDIRRGPVDTHDGGSYVDVNLQTIAGDWVRFLQPARSLDDFLRAFEQARLSVERVSEIGGKRDGARSVESWYVLYELVSAR